MRWMVATVLACMGAACTVDVGDEGDGGICVDAACSMGTGGSGGSESGSPGDATGRPETTSSDPDSAGPCASEYVACIEEGFEKAVCDDMLAECEMAESSSSGEPHDDPSDTHGEPGDDSYDAAGACCTMNGGSASVCGGIVDACDGVNACNDALGDCNTTMPTGSSCADAYDSCREDACFGVIEACRPPELDPTREPCADALRKCAMHAPACAQIVDSPTPQESCESSIPDALFCEQWIIVCEERRVACDAVLASSDECSSPSAPCDDAWGACMDDAPSFGPCWDEFEACELAPPDCPEMDGGEGEPCTCAEQLASCVRADENDDECQE